MPHSICCTRKVCLPYELILVTPLGMKNAHA